MQVVGIAKSSFKGDKGEDINGYAVHSMYPINEKYGEGFAVSKMWVSERRYNELPKLAIGDEITYTGYNRNGKPNSYAVIPITASPDKK